MFLADFHTHTTYSDGKLSPRELVDFYGSRGFGAIAITDHLCEEKTLLGKAAAYLNKTLLKSNFYRYLEHIKEEAERAWDVYKMIVIPGVELTKNSLQNHRSAHMLALGIEKYIPADSDVLSATKEIRNQGGISIAAHPISHHPNPIRSGNYYLWDQRSDLYDAFDAWEITDSQKILSEVMDSKLPKIANSDFHRPQHIRSWMNSLECEKNVDAILDCIRKQKLSFQYYVG